MEINNATHFSHDAYLLSHQQSASDFKNVEPAEQVKDEKNPDNKSAQTQALIERQTSKSTTEQTGEIQSASLFQPVNLIRAQQQNSENPKQASYKITAQQQQLAHRAEQAITTYNKVENTQYGQELVNRIETMV